MRKTTMKTLITSGKSSLKKKKTIDQNQLNENKKMKKKVHPARDIMVENLLLFNEVLLLVLFAFLLAGSINAQVKETYTFSSFVDPNGYSVVSPGTGTVLYRFIPYDTSTYNNLDVGFTFNFNGANYNKFSINDNGFIALGSTVTNSNSAINLGATNNIVCAFNTNLLGSMYTKKGDTTVGSELRYATWGVAPKRILVVQFTTFTKPAPLGSVSDNYNFQIRLTEDSNKIQVVYGTMVNGSNSGNVEVGLRGSSALDFNNVTTTDWKTFSAGNLNSSTCPVSATTVITSGLTLTWTPKAVPIAYVSTTTTQNVDTLVGRNTVNNQIIGFQTVISGNTGSLNLTGVKLGSGGTTNFSRDVKKVKIFYTGISSVFDTTTLFGSSPNVDDTIRGNTVLVGGTNPNYFWVTYDIPANAKSKDTVDAQCIAVTFSNIGTKAPDIQDPAGCRRISPWRRKADFGGGPRSGAIAFSLGGKGYLGTGWGMSDMWEYDPLTDRWSQLASDFPGAPRQWATAFTIGSKAYVGTGFIAGTQNHNGSNDLWEFDPNPDSTTWKKKADVPGNLRWGAYSFSIGAKGYIGGGIGNAVGSSTNPYLLDFYEFDPDSIDADSNTIPAWSLLSTTRPATYNSPSFSTNKGYVTAGSALSEFDPATNSWLPKGSNSGMGMYSSAFVYKGKGYNISSRIFRRYDFDSNSWERLEDLPWVARTDHVGFLINGVEYVGTGRSVGPTLYSDFWSLELAVPGTAFTSSSIKICEGDAVKFTDQSTGTVDSRNWSFPGGTPSSPTDKNPTVIYNTRGTYSVTLITTNENGDSTITKQDYITVLQRPQVDAGQDITICSGSSIQLKAVGFGSTQYKWSPSNGLSCTDCQQTEATPKVTTTYKVTLTSDSGCTAEDSVVVNVVPSFVARPGADTSLCKGDTIHLSATGGTYYNWSSQHGLSNYHIATPDAWPDTTTTYTLTVSGDGSCPSDSAQIKITVYPKPAKPIITLGGAGTTLHSSASIGNQWYKDGQIINGATAQDFDPTQSGQYTVKVTDNNVCSSTSNERAVTVGVQEKLSTSLSKVEILSIYPNPSSNGTVVRFTAQNDPSLTIKIYDVFGREVETMVKRSLNDGEHEITLSTQNYSNGLYFCRMNNRGVVTVRPFSVER